MSSAAQIVLRLLLSVVLAAGLSATSTTAGAAVGADDRFGENTPIIVVLDTSGSMDEQVYSAGASRFTRLDTARSAVVGLVNALPTGQIYGMLSYPGGPDVDGCNPGQVRTALGAVNTSSAVVAVRTLSADGGTPSGPALQSAADLLKQAGHTRGTIVLVSDGESNCGTPPCEVAKTLVQDGYEVTINTVGFENSDLNADELRCVASATGGRYIEVDEAELVDGVVQSAQPQLSVTVDAPPMSVLVGSPDEHANQMNVTVGSTGAYDAKDVRVTVSWRETSDDEKLRGRILVTRPVRFLGNLAQGTSRVQTFSSHPDEGGEYTYVVTVTAQNAPTVQRTGVVLVRSGTSKEDLGQVLDGVDRVVILGDSYSSGEGAGAYEEDVDHDCHRSDWTYGRAIWSDATVIACSGAVTRDLRMAQRSGGETVQPQLAALRELAVSPESPEAVLLTIGGNDSGFGDFAKACIFLPECSDLWVHDIGGALRVDLTWARMLQRALAIQPDVTQALRDIDAAVNDAEALRRRGGKVAPVVILQYPRILPSAAEAAGRCLYGLDSDEVGHLNRYLDTLNSAVALASYQLRHEGRPVYTVGQTVPVMQPNHTICDGAQSWAVTAPTDFDLVSAKILGRDKELLHPNVEGHRALARAVVQWSNTPAAAPIEVQGTPRWDGTIVDPPRLPFFLRPLTYVASSLGTTSPGDQVTILSAGHLPGSQVVIWLESSPTTLGIAQADEEGRVDQDVLIPEDAEAGAHTLFWLGPDEDARMVLHSQDLELHPRGTTAWVLMGVTGLLLATFGVGLLLVLSIRDRRRGVPRTA